jgi:dTDP-glucose pyrophosphorylase
MAGTGSRFREAGYAAPKFAIEVLGHSLLWWSVSSLTGFLENGAPLTFVARKMDAADDAVTSVCHDLNVPEFHLVEIDRLTDGQASTVLAADRYMNGDDPILIYNVDTYVEPSYLRLSDMRGEGWIPCFRGKGDAWSFVACNEKGVATEVREKKRISPLATIGLYGFASFDLFRTTYEDYYQSKQNEEMGEKYIAPMYNHLIAAGLDVFAHEVPVEAVHPLGTPADVLTFEQPGDVG